MHVKTILSIIILMNSVCFAQDWMSNFDIEGSNPVIDSETFEFSAVASKFLTKNGHGWRNEVKKKVNLRTSMYSVHEKIDCSLSVYLDSGTKTIVTQYHEEGTGTLMLLFISDYAETNGSNGIYNDGIFDVYVRYRDDENKSKMIPLGTIRSGDTAAYSMENNRGKVTIIFNGKTAEFTTKNSNNVYLKFGDYLQAQDPDTKQFVKHQDYSEYYKNRAVDKIVFKNLKYTEFK